MEKGLEFPAVYSKERSGKEKAIPLKTLTIPRRREKKDCPKTMVFEPCQEQNPKRGRKGKDGGKRNHVSITNTGGGWKGGCGGGWPKKKKRVRKKKMAEKGERYAMSARGQHLGWVRLGGCGGNTCRLVG